MRLLPDFPVMLVCITNVLGNQRKEPGGGRGQPVQQPTGLGVLIRIFNKDSNRNQTGESAGKGREQPVGP